MSRSAEMYGRLKVGDKAPEFEGLTGDGNFIRLKDFIGKKHVVLYFYPKDDTPGCTREACGFRDSYEKIRELGAEVVGVSLDSVKSHKKFSAKYDLPFMLLSDEDKAIAKAYDSLGVGGLVARRVTFIIDRDGIIRYIFPKVDVSVHAQEVLEALKRLA